MRHKVGPGVKPLDTRPPENRPGEADGDSPGNRESELNALRGKGKGFKGLCFHGEQYGHRLAECMRKYADLMKGKGKKDGVGKGKNPQQRQVQCGRGKGRNWEWLVVVPSWDRFLEVQIRTTLL